MKRTACVLGMLAGAALLAGRVPAKTVNIEYILDASGSMQELVGGEVKMDIAKRTLSGLVDRLPSSGTEISVNVGLRVYGHGEADPAGRCRDTALEVPLQGVDARAIKDKVAALEPKGWTPIAYALGQAKGDFPPGDADNIVILISDGKETCGGDPCAVARELHASGIKLTIHVVGFAVKPEEKASLECIATEAGGKYFGAATASELNDVLIKAQEQVLKTETQSVRIKIGGIAKLRFDPASWVPGPPYRYRLESVADGKTAAQGGGTLDEVKVSPGTYRLVWRQSEHGVGETVLFDKIEIAPGETSVLRLDTGVHLVPASWIKEPPYEWFLRDGSNGKKVLSVSGTFDPVLAPAGAYDLGYRQWEHGSGDVVLSRTLTIEPGKVTEVELNTGVRLLASDPQAKPPYRWILADPKTKAPVATVYGEWGPIPVPAGVYSLLVQQTEHGHELGEVVPEFAVQGGQLAELEF